MIYVYAIIEQPERPLPRVKGLDDTPIGVCSRGVIGAAVSLGTSARPEITEATLWRHEAVLEALMAERAVLPVRFGTVVGDEAALREMLQSRCEAFAANLDLVRGQVEIALRVLDPTPLNPPFVRGEASPLLTKEGSGEVGQGPGVAYMSRRLEEHRREQDWLGRSQDCRASIEKAFDGLVTRSVWRAPSRPPTLLQSSHMISGGRLDELRDRMNDLRAANASWRFLCTGPWPPFSFVEGATIDER